MLQTDEGTAPIVRSVGFFEWAEGRGPLLD